MESSKIGVGSSSVSCDGDHKAKFELLLYCLEHVKGRPLGKATKAVAA